MITFPKDFKKFLQLLHLKKIEYLVIGGYAVGLYGYPRATGDMDIWIAIHEQNAEKLIENNLTLDHISCDTERRKKRIGEILFSMNCSLIMTIFGVFLFYFKCAVQI